MNRFKKSILWVSVMSTLGAASSAFACIPEQRFYYQPVSPEEAKLPIVVPNQSVDSSGCPVDEILVAFDSLTDDQIAQYLGTGTSGSTTPSYPAWNATTAYVGGDSVSYNGKNYRARWWTQGEAPPGTSGVWEEITTTATATATSGNPPAWSSSTAYSGGSQVTYQSNIYKAKRWTQGEVPGTQWSAWELVGPAASNAGARPAMFHAATLSEQGSYPPQWQISWSTAPFSTSEHPLANNWQVRLDGTVVQQGTNITTSVADCAPGASPCGAQYTQSGSFAVTAGRGDLMTFWLCKDDVCRMTPRVSWWRGGEEQGTTGSTPTPTPAPTPTPTPAP